MKIKNGESCFSSWCLKYGNVRNFSQKGNLCIKVFLCGLSGNTMVIVVVERGTQVLYVNCFTNARTEIIEMKRDIN